MSEVVLKAVSGWTCDCLVAEDDEGHLIAHYAQFCPDRRPVHGFVPTVPGWTVPRRADPSATAVAQLPPVEVRARVALPGQAPAMAVKLCAASWSHGHPASILYARGWRWTQERIAVAADDEGGWGDDRGKSRGKERKTRDVPRRVESAAVHSSLVTVVWERARPTGGGAAG